MDAAQLTLLQETRSYVEDIFNTQLSPSYIFHNLLHTQEVVRASEEMADYYHLSGEDRLVLLLAAWFHDTGYSRGDAERHEEAGVEIARGFLQRIPAAAPLVERVASCIRATRQPQSPANLVEQILCDADLFHLGTHEFKERTKLLRKEMNLLGPHHFNKTEWEGLNKMFLSKHHYFTGYGRERLAPVQEENLRGLNRKQGGKEEAGQTESASEEERGQQSGDQKDGREPGEKDMKDKDVKELKDSKEGGEAKAGKGAKDGKDKEGRESKEGKEKEGKDAKDKKSGESERGITTTFRITSSNHANLSHMADNKAHILISVNSIIISIVISLLIRHLEDHHNLIFPTTVLMIVSVVTMVFSILATRPNVSHGVFTHQDIEKRKVNLLFFGNFFNMSLEEYEWAMKEMIVDRDYMYASIIKDIYFQGIVLARKYKYLRIAYNIFMYGIILSVVAFSVTMFFFM